MQSLEILDGKYDELLAWLYDNKQIFNSGQYLEVMNIISRIIKIDTPEKEIIMNNYTIHSSDEEEEEISNSDDDSTYTGDYI
jgi:hypothetical protein